MKHFKFINKLIVLTVITSSIFTTIAKADEVSNNRPDDNKLKSDP